MKLILIDDSINDIKMMLSYICKNEKIIVDYYTDCAKVPFNDINCYDAILLDIDMPNENGISYAKRLRKTYHDIPIVFISWHSSYEHESFQVHPFMFIYKENFQKEIIICMNELKIRQVKMDKIFEYKDIKLQLNDILYFRAEKNDCNIVMNNKKNICIRIPLEKIEKMQLSGFVRINKSMIINMYKIVKWCKYQEIEIINGEFLKISRGRKDYVKSEYENFLLEDSLYECI